MNECQHLLVLNDQIGVILGGHYDRYNKIMLHFLENMHKTGAKLVFFMPGRRQSDDLPFFIPKTEDAYIESLEILDKLKAASNLTAFLKGKNRLQTDVRVELSFDYNLQKLIQGFGDLHCTYELHNQKIARYAQENSQKVLALISDDTDFLSFSGAFEFWHTKTMNINKMSCDQYNRYQLYDHLGFVHGHAQMQILSALTDSIYLPSFVVEGFLAKLANANKDPNKTGVIWNVSAYLKQLKPLTIVDNKVTYNLEQISRDVFGDDHTNEQFNAISNGLAVYDLDFEQPQNHSTNIFSRRVKQHKSFVYKLATDTVFNVGDIDYMDYRNYKSKTYADLVVPVLMKLCGVLYQIHPRPPKMRKICVKHAHDEPSKVTQEIVIYPSSE